MTTKLTTKEIAERDAVLARIAFDKLGFETLATRNMDSLDFREVAAWSVQAALEAAFAAGRASTRNR